MAKRLSADRARPHGLISFTWPLLSVKFTAMPPGLARSCTPPHSVCSTRRPSRPSPESSTDVPSFRPDRPLGSTSRSSTGWSGPEISPDFAVGFRSLLRLTDCPALGVSAKKNETIRRQPSAEFHASCVSFARYGARSQILYKRFTVAWHNTGSDWANRFLVHEISHERGRLACGFWRLAEKTILAEPRMATHRTVSVGQTPHCSVFADAAPAEKTLVRSWPRYERSISFRPPSNEI